MINTNIEGDIDIIEEQIQNKKAVNYDELFFQSIAEFPLRKKIADYLFHINADKDSKIIDVGCGTGELLSYLSSQGFSSLFGNDISEGMINVAKKKRSNITFFHGNINKCIINEKFDFIIITEALHHIPDLKLTFETFEKLLNDNGKVILLEPNEDWYFENITTKGFLHKIPYILISPLRLLFRYKNRKIIDKNKEFDTPDTFSPVHRHLTVEEVKESLTDLKISHQKYHTYFLGLFESCLFQKNLIDRLAYRFILFLDSLILLGNRGKYFFLVLNKKEKVPTN